MTTDLKRDLGLLSTTALAIGAMVDSGIFMLPAIASVAAGPAAVVAVLIAGLVVFTAAISAAEMATAMPEDGGDLRRARDGTRPWHRRRHRHLADTLAEDDPTADVLECRADPSVGRWTNEKGIGGWHTRSIGSSAVNDCLG